MGQIGRSSPDLQAVGMLIELREMFFTLFL
jgi:hypothetical protein